MGVGQQMILNVVATATLLGALKRQGVIAVSSHRIENNNLRKAFELFVDCGEFAAEKLETAAKELGKALSSK